MPIPESQLETWSKQGAGVGSRDTYASVRRALEGGDYHGSPTIFLQGSYGNDTNIYAESDVDVVIRTDEFFYYDIDALSDTEKAAFHAAHPNSKAGSYGYDDFKNDVLKALRKQFGSSAVIPGKRAIAILPSGNRRSADVIVAAKHRRYYTFPGTPHEGITFFTSTSEQINNFPKQHSDNCTTKHQATDCGFKPTIRVLKNLRGCLVDRDLIDNKSVAPSYFLEGLVYNVPNTEFRSTYQSTLAAVLTWLHAADVDKLECANGLYYLVRGSNVTWSRTNYDLFLAQAIKLWNEW